jgi:hypothetical protein
VVECSDQGQRQHHRRGIATTTDAETGTDATLALTLPNALSCCPR